MPSIKYSIDPMSTHSVFLESTLKFALNEINRNQKLILFEIGTGGKSSEIMRRITDDNSNVELISFENDINWIQMYRENYSVHPRHELCQINDLQDWETKISIKLQSIPKESYLVSFIDSAPWESRVITLNLLKDISQIVLIHDVDYFPHNKIFGVEKVAIKYKPKNRLHYGKLNSKYLGVRTYDKEFQSWVEVFPKKPGYFTGPPTLIGSNRIQILGINFDKNAIIQNKNISSPNMTNLDT